MGLLRRIDAQSRDVPAPRQALRRGIDAGGLARRGQRQHRGGGGGVGDQPVEAVGKAKRLADPVDDDLLEFRPDRTRPPQHHVRVQRGGQHLADDSRPGRRAAEIRQESRVLPVGDVRFEQAPVVGQNLPNRLRRLGRRLREERPERARLDLREDRSVRDALEIVGHDVDRQVSGRSEGLRIHVVETG